MKLWRLLEKNRTTRIWKSSAYSFPIPEIEYGITDKAGLLLDIPIKDDSRNHNLVVINRPKVYISCIDFHCTMLNDKLNNCRIQRVMKQNINARYNATLNYQKSKNINQIATLGAFSCHISSTKNNYELVIFEFQSSVVYYEQFYSI